MDYSFYGGKQGNSFNIEKNYTSVESMIEDFKRGSGCKISYGGYVIVANEDENISYLYRRGFDYASQNGGAELITSLTGAKGKDGRDPQLEFVDFDTIFSESSGESSYSDNTVDVLKGKFIDEEGHEHYNDSPLVNSYTYTKREVGDDEEETEKLMMRVGIKTVAPTFDFKMEPALINIDATDEQKTGKFEEIESEHPYHHNYKVTLPVFQLNAVNNLGWNEKTNSLEINYNTIVGDGNVASAQQTVHIPVDTADLKYDSEDGTISKKGLKSEYVPVYYSAANNEYPEFTLDDLRNKFDGKDPEDSESEIKKLFYNEKDSAFRPTEENNYRVITDDGDNDTDDLNKFYFKYKDSENNFGVVEKDKIGTAEDPTKDLDGALKLYTSISTITTIEVGKISQDYFTTATINSNENGGSTIVTLNRKDGNEDESKSFEIPNIILDGAERTIGLNGNTISLAKIDSENRVISVDDNEITVPNVSNDVGVLLNSDYNIIDNPADTSISSNREMDIDAFGFLLVDVNDNYIMRLTIPVIRELFSYSNQDGRYRYEGSNVEYQKRSIESNANGLLNYELFENKFNEEYEKYNRKTEDENSVIINSKEYSLRDSIPFPMNSDESDFSWVYIRQKNYTYLYKLFPKIRYGGTETETKTPISLYGSDINSYTQDELKSEEIFGDVDLASKVNEYDITVSDIPYILSSDGAKQIFNFKEFITYSEFEIEDGAVSNETGESEEGTANKNYMFDINLSEGYDEIDKITLKFGETTQIDFSGLKYNNSGIVIKSDSIDEIKEGFILSYLDAVLDINDTEENGNGKYTLIGGTYNSTNSLSVGRKITCDTEVVVTADSKQYDIKEASCDGSAIVFTFVEFVEEEAGE